MIPSRHFTREYVVRVPLDEVGDARKIKGEGRGYPPFQVKEVRNHE